jgi:hypothetical protein
MGEPEPIPSPEPQPPPKPYKVVTYRELSVKPVHNLDALEDTPGLFFRSTTGELIRYEVVNSEWVIAKPSRSSLRRWDRLKLAAELLCLVLLGAGWLWLLLTWTSPDYVP